MHQTLYQALESNMNNSYGACFHSHNKKGAYFLSTCYGSGTVLGLQVTGFIGNRR